MLRSFLYLSFSSLFLFSCMTENDFSAGIDQELQQLLKERGDGTLEYFQMPNGYRFDEIPQDPNNLITASKMELGQMLFHETALSANSNFVETEMTYSCASCHHAQGGFQANLPQGIGDGGFGFGMSGEGRMFGNNLDLEKIDVQPIRTPSALNIAYQTNLLWNGQFGATAVNANTQNLWNPDTPIAANRLGFEGAETQAIAGLAVHRLEPESLSFLWENDIYKDLFEKAFPDLNDHERYTTKNIGLAIAAYERTLLANQSNFQKYVSGDNNAMTHEQKQGAILFFANNCGDCHTGPALNTMEFHAYGMNDLQESGNVINTDPNDNAHLGRGGFTKNANDNYKFKVPQLYNLRDSPFLGHGSSFTSVREVVEYKNNGIPQNDNVDHSQLADQFKPMGLMDFQVDLLVDFIENGLYDPDLARYAPEEIPSGNCFPNNDPESRIDIGCD